MRSGLAVAAVGAWLLAGAPAATAQTASTGRVVAVTGGINSEHAEDGLRGTSAGGGAIVGLRIKDAWMIEGEFWYPGAIPVGARADRHRDVLVGVDVRRAFGRRRARPHLLAGLTVAQTEDTLTTCTAMRPAFGSTTPLPVVVSCADPDVIGRQVERHRSASLFSLLGAGVEIDISSNWRLIPMVRLHVAPTSVIARPAIAIARSF